MCECVWKQARARVELIDCVAGRQAGKQGSSKEGVGGMGKDSRCVCVYFNVM